MPGADPEFTATQSQTQVWGRSGFGCRGHEGDPRDGVEVGRLASSSDPSKTIAVDYARDTAGNSRNGEIVKTEKLNAFERAIEPWIGIGDDDEAMREFANFSFTTDSIRQAIRRDLSLHFQTLQRDEGWQIVRELEDVDGELDVDLVRSWDAVMAPFDIADDPKVVFRLIADEIVRTLRAGQFVQSPVSTGESGRQRDE